MARFIADSNDCPKLRVNRRILRAVERAISQAKLEGCGVDQEHQDAMRLYLTTWVVGPLEAAVQDMLGKKRSTW